MALKTIFVDPSRCIGCRACEAACRECDSHKGESMIMVDFIDRGWSVATQPTLCMHCEDPVAPCPGLPGPGHLHHRGGSRADGRCFALHRLSELRLRLPLRRPQVRPRRRG